MPNLKGTEGRIIQEIFTGFNAAMQYVVLDPFGMRVPNHLPFCIIDDNYNEATDGRIRDVMTKAMKRGAVPRGDFSLAHIGLGYRTDLTMSHDGRVVFPGLELGLYKPDLAETYFAFIVASSGSVNSLSQEVKGSSTRNFHLMPSRCGLVFVTRNLDDARRVVSIDQLEKDWGKEYLVRRLDGVSSYEQTRLAEGLHGKQELVQDGLTKLFSR